jgi:hypothetical protein
VLLVATAASTVALALVSVVHDLVAVIAFLTCGALPSLRRSRSARPT